MVERRWATYFSLSYTDAMRTEAGQGPMIPELSTDAHWLLDLTVNYNVHRNVRLYLQMRNLTDETYIAARRPAGIRPGMPRNVLAGVSWNF